MLIHSGCASIVSKSKYPISIDSYPTEARITVKNRRGRVVHEGMTPSVVMLKASGGFFRRGVYMVEYRKPNYEKKTAAIKFELDGWYFGNLIFPGILGLIIDPITGAMFRPQIESYLEHLKAGEGGNKFEKSPSKWGNPSKWD